MTPGWCLPRAQTLCAGVKGAWQTMWAGNVSPLIDSVSVCVWERGSACNWLGNSGGWLPVSHVYIHHRPWVLSGNGGGGVDVRVTPQIQTLYIRTCMTEVVSRCLFRAKNKPCVKKRLQRLQLHLLKLLRPWGWNYFLEKWGNVVLKQPLLKKLQKLVF